MDQLRTYGGRPGADRRDERRARLLSVGRHLLTAPEGPTGFSVRGVCREAGLTPRYFYESFADVGDLARAVYDECIAAITVDTTTALGELGTDNRAAVHRGMTALVDLIAADPSRGRLLFSPALAAVPEIAERRLSSTRMFVKLVGAEASGRVELQESAPVHVAAELLVGGVAQVISAWLDGHLEVERPVLAATLAETFLALGPVVAPGDAAPTTRLPAVPHTFEPAVVDAVLAHMNDDHTDDALLIVRAFGQPEADAATMTGLDGDAGVFSAIVGGVATEVRVPWSEPITERPQIRREVVVLYDRACAALGLEPRPH